MMAVVPADAPVITVGVQESFIELHPWMPWARTKQSHEQTLEFIRHSTASRATRTELNYSIWAGGNVKGRTLDRYVGGIGIHHINWEVPRFELGYWLRTSRTGRGFATEAVRCLSDCLIKLYQPPRLEIRTDSRNQPSCRVAERAGYAQEAVLRKCMRDHRGQLADSVVYVMFP